jgi:hypothetical protein
MTQSLLVNPCKDVHMDNFTTAQLIARLRQNADVLDLCAWVYPAPPERCTAEEVRQMLHAVVIDLRQIADAYEAEQQQIHSLKQIVDQAIAGVQSP